MFKLTDARVSVKNQRSYHDNDIVFYFTMKNVFYFIVTISILISVCSCGTYNCGQSGGLTINTIGITTAERDTIILRKFVKGSGFTQMIDTFYINAGYFETNDTATVASLSGGGRLTSNYDYQIYFPVIGKLVKITDINEPQQKMKRGLFSTDKTYCVNAIASYQQDGKTITLTDYQDKIFIHR